MASYTETMPRNRLPESTQAGSIMTTPDEYRRHAEQARKMAADISREDDKVFWQKLAGDWEKLAQLAHEAADQKRKA